MLLYNSIRRENFNIGWVNQAPRGKGLSSSYRFYLINIHDSGVFAAGVLAKSIIRYRSLECLPLDSGNI